MMTEAAFWAIGLVFFLLVLSRVVLYGKEGFTAEGPVWKYIILLSILFLIARTFYKQGYVEFCYSKEFFAPITAFTIILSLVWTLAFRKMMAINGGLYAKRSFFLAEIWRKKFFLPGSIFKKRGQYLEQRKKVKKAIEDLEKFINIQKRGVADPFRQKSFKLTENIDDDSPVMIPCLFCRRPYMLSASIRGGLHIDCYCKAQLSFKRGQGKKQHIMYVAAVKKDAKRINSNNKKNIALAYETISVIKRVMNRLEEAETFLKIALSYAEKAIREYDESCPKIVILEIKASLLLKKGELKQVYGLRKEAEDFYENAALLYREIGLTRTSRMIRLMINEM